MDLVAGMHNPSYMEMKAVELIMEAGQAVATDLVSYHDKLKQAITLLALARAERGPTENK